MVELTVYVQETVVKRAPLSDRKLGLSEDKTKPRTLKHVLVTKARTASLFSHSNLDSPKPRVVRVPVKVSAATVG